MTMRTFNENKIYFNGQPIALVIANTFQSGPNTPASLVQIRYNKEAHQSSLDANTAKYLQTFRRRQQTTIAAKPMLTKTRR